MKKYPLFLAFVLIIFSPVASSAMVGWQVVSPITFTRGTGEPVTEPFTFSSLGGTATIKLYNGGAEDSDIEKVSSSTITLNGQLVFGPSNFNQNVDYLEKEVSLLEGENTLEVLLKGKPGGQVTIQIVQEVAVITPEISIIQTANALRTGDIDLVMEGCWPDEKGETLIRSLDTSSRNELAHWIDSAELVEETPSFKFYRYSWADETGNNFVTFIMSKDLDGKWIIRSW